MLTLILAAALAAAPWPAKGDTVFVSATLAHVIGPMPMPGGLSPERVTTVPPCVPSTVKRAKPDWVIIKGPAGSGQALDGPWLPRLHRTEAECSATMTSLGEPRIARSGGVFTIVP
jgi:hypothetical protein